MWSRALLRTGVVALGMCLMSVLTAAQSNVVPSDLPGNHAQFECETDSLNVYLFVVFSQGSDRINQWEPNKGRPALGIQAIAPGQRKPHELPLVGKFVDDGERAVFLVPKARILGLNLRVVPVVKNASRGGGWPLVDGDWAVYDDGPSWHINIALDATGRARVQGWR